MRKVGWPLLVAAVGALLVSTAWGASGGPLLAWSPVTSAGTYDYGVMTVGGGRPQSFTLQNTGNKPSGQLAIALTGSAFLKTTDTCTGTNLGASKSCAVTVKYTAAKPSPSDQGSLTASSNKVTMASLTLRGVTRAAAPAILTTPAPGSGPIGITLQDTASLSGGFTPSGSIVFSLYAGSGCSTAPVYQESVPINGNGNYRTTSGYIARNAGGYQWTASYGGDGNNLPATSGCGLEGVTIAKAVPALSTTPQPSTGPMGTTLQDTANLANGVSPSGTITFTLYAGTGCSTQVAQEPVTVTGNGNYSTTVGFKANVPGPYQWMATYSGDGNNQVVNTTCGAEPATVTAAASLSTAPSPGAAQVGAFITDIATLTGGNSPTGSLNFHLYSRPDCMNQPVFSDHANVTGDGTFQPNHGPYQVTVPGTYEWTVDYTGDGANPPASSPCGDEPVTITPAATTLSTIPNPPGGPAGVTLQDKATLSGGFSPSGTITFTLYATGNCSGGPVDQEIVPVTANGSYVTPTGYKAAGAGNYQWTAHYSGDGDNTPSDSPCGSELVTVNPAVPTLTTSPQPASGPTGTVLEDNATLANGFAPAGSITFSLYAGGNCSGAPVAQQTVTVTGNGSYSTSTGFQANAAGTYEWTATYGGDGNNAQAVSSCGQEPVSVNGVATPTVTTSASAGGPVGTVLHDTADLEGGSSPTGSIVFKLYPTGDCSGGAVFQTSSTVAGNGPVTSQPGYTTTSAGSYQWVVSYGGDSGNMSVSTTCGQEPVTITGVSLSTTPMPAVAHVGDLITDSATLSGAPSTAGAINFTLYAHSDCTQQVAAGKANETGDGTYEPENGPYLMSAPGTYYWTAKWNGGGVDQPVTSPCGAETVTVSPALTALTTIPNPASGAAGSLFQDTASLTGGYNPSGTITFQLFSTSGCAGAPVDTEAVGVSGNNGYQTPAGFRPAATGTYQWLASYSGDANNAPAVSACGSEQVTVTAASPTLTTTPQPSSGLTGTMLKDSAVIGSGSAPTGSILFSLYQGSDCTGAPVDQETVTVNGNGSYTTPMGFTATAPGTYEWTASYAGDGTNNPAAESCGQEPVTITAPVRHVYWTITSTNFVGRANTDGSNIDQSFIASNVKKPKAIAVNGQFVYWANSASSSIGRANLDGSAPNLGFIANIQQPVGIAVDGNYIYWSWSNGGQAGAIGRANLDGTGVIPSLITIQGSPQGIAVDSGHIYWADASTQSIGRANLDGTSPNPTFISSAFAFAPEGVAVNGSNIYWTNSANNTIGRASLDGTNPVASFIVSGVSSPQSIAVDSTYLYWADAGTGAIVRANLDGTTLLGIPTGSVPFGVAVDAG